MASPRCVTLVVLGLLLYVIACSLGIDKTTICGVKRGEGNLPAKKKEKEEAKNHERGRRKET